MKHELIGNKFFVETKNFKVVLNKERGGTIVQYIMKPDNINVLYREGIEMYWAVPKKDKDMHVNVPPHITPRSEFEEKHWDNRHFEQEYGGTAKLDWRLVKDCLIVRTESPCSWTIYPPKYYGKTITQLYFREDLPYIYIEFEENCLNMNPEGTERWFKRYTGGPPKVFTHYAKKLDSWAIDNLSIIPNSENYLENDVYVRTPLEMQIEGDPPRYPATKWLTLFNNNIGFAMIPKNLKLWRGDDYPKSSRCGLFHSWAMDELIYYCRLNEKQIHRLDMIYYAFHTTHKKQYHVLDEIDLNGFEDAKDENCLV